MLFQSHTEEHRAGLLHPSFGLCFSASCSGGRQEGQPSSGPWRAVSKMLHVSH